jgi:hypothetical protein
MTDIFDNGNACVFDFDSIAAYVNRKQRPAVEQVAPREPLKPGFTENPKPMKAVRVHWVQENKSKQQILAAKRLAEMREAYLDDKVRAVVAGMKTGEYLDQVRREAASRLFEPKQKET